MPVAAPTVPYNVLIIQFEMHRLIAEHLLLCLPALQALHFLHASVMPEEQRQQSTPTDGTDDALTSVVPARNAADVLENCVATRRMHFQDHCLVLVREQVSLDLLI